MRGKPRHNPTLFHNRKPTHGFVFSNRPLDTIRHSPRSIAASPDLPIYNGGILVKAFLFLLLPAALCAQTSSSLQQGQALFRSNCAFCHGGNARGGRGPNLVSAPLAHGDTNESLMHVIRTGVPGTTMPAFSEFTDEELAQIVAYLHSLSKNETRQQHIPGDPRQGRELYESNGCAGCHRINGVGSIFGPDLTRIGAARSIEYLRESIVQPSADIPEEFEGVTVALRDGAHVRGIRINEDGFSLQLRDASQKIRMFQKDELSGVVYEKQSLMPAYNQLAPADLDSLVAYLASLKGAVEAAVAAPAPSLPFDRIVHALDEPQNWLTYWGDYSAQRYRTLKQIDTSNVKDLRLEWMFQTGQSGAFETVPLVVDGIMYFTAAGGFAYAIDARSGRQLWQYKYPMADNIKLCCGTINRGLAMLDGRLFMATPDAHVVALEASTGQLLWNTAMAPGHAEYGATLAPLAVNGKVIAGVSGGEFGIRGFVDAYDARTGARVWRFYTVPAKGEPGGDTWLAESWQRGGGPTWMTGTYDPELNTLYWGVGNPGPDLYGDGRKGDNLYTASLVALDADSGKLKWHFQFTPHDTHDWDACETPMLLDLKWKGRDRKVVVQANRNAFFYVLDRETGEFLRGRSFARQTWAKELDKNGRPVLNGNPEPTAEGNRVCPGLAGAANWMAPSYNPETGWFYFPVREQCDEYYSAPPVYVAGKAFWGSMSRGQTEEKEWGLLKALDPLTGETKWDFRFYRAPWAGTLATAGGLIFAGDEDGYFMAFDAKTGKNLWKVNTGNRLVTAAITYEVKGRQFVTMPSGSALMTFALPH